jgi:Fic family protein
MNCYYSNLIEGHDTLPHDIERAMRSDYSTEPGKRNLQLEARAHIEVQAMVDHGELDHLGFGKEFVRALHREFCDRLPEDLLWVTDGDTGMRNRIVPGEWREGGVIVGNHVAIGADLVPAFMAHFEWG